MVSVNPIHSEADYEAALAEIECIMDAKPNTPKGDRLDILVTLVQAYETRNYPIEAPDPIDLIRFALAARNLKLADLEPMIGGSGRVSEVMNRKRSLTLPMIRRLKDGLGLPAEILVKEYKLAKKVA
jgi:HTH-type transcriptional regulator/antitoxin HigA